MKRIAGSLVNSHIQVPRFLLKRFENEKNFFYYYSVENAFIGNGGHSKTFYTERGYYSQTTEEYLNKYAEKPFSELLSIVDNIDFDSPAIPVSPEIDKVVKRFIYALISRSPQMVSGIHEHSLFYKYLPSQEQHDIAAEGGIELAEKLSVLGDYSVTFAYNKTAQPLVLPMCGIYNFRIHKVDTVFLPISPNLSIALVKKDGIDNLIQNGAVFIFHIIDSDGITWFNRHAVSAQKRTGYGFVVSPDRATLEQSVDAS